MPDRLRALGAQVEPALAQWHAATGEVPRALELLARLRVQGNLPPTLQFDPLFEPLRADARYLQLMHP